MHEYVFIHGNGSQEILEFNTYEEASKYAQNNDNVYRWYTLHKDCCNWWATMADCSCGAYTYKKG